MEFEWDPKKSATNVRKHDVTFQEASTVFGDRLAMTFVDPDHSNNEQRYLTFGLSKYNRLLVVAHTDRGEKTRIISARLMDRKERRIYEEG
ncbi:MAG: BrnT family toxin [Nitrospirota bacterium]